MTVSTPCPNPGTPTPGDSSERAQSAMAGGRGDRPKPGFEIGTARSTSRLASIMGMAKNLAAVALGRLGGKARMTRMTAQERSAVARLGALARHGKPLKPSRWWVLAGEDPDKFEVVFASHDKQEVRDYARKTKSRGALDYVDYDPRGLTIVHKFKPDVVAQVEALKIAVEQKMGKA